MWERRPSNLKLDFFCTEQAIATVSESTIGRVVSDLKKRGTIPRYRSLSYNAKQDSFKERRITKRKKLRRGSYKPEKPGDILQLDSITLFSAGIKRYIITAVDLKSKFGLAYCYGSLTSKNAADFMDKLRIVCPFEIKHIQTDNGGEFAKHFTSHLDKHSITHFHNYPKRPQMNAHVERFNRTVKEQYVR